MDTTLDDSINNTLPVDLTGNAAYAAEFRYQRALRFGSAALLAALVISAAGNAWQSRRPPVVLVVRVDDAGRAAAIRYDALHYTPREAEVRSRLNQWAVYRYRLLKATAADFRLNYEYLEGAEAQRLMQDDSAKVAKIIAGTGEEEDVAINNIQFTALDASKLPDGAVASGEASIDLTKILDPAGRADRQHWTITVKYEVNPDRAASDPQLENLNPLGVTITWFHEDRAFN